jgi:hypothetical protein
MVWRWLGIGTNADPEDGLLSIMVGKYIGLFTDAWRLWDPVGP